jgi:hypothetical protein
MALRTLRLRSSTRSLSICAWQSGASRTSSSAAGRTYTRRCKVAAVIASHRDQPLQKASLGPTALPALPHEDPGILRRVACELAVIEEARAETHQARSMALHQNLEGIPRSGLNQDHQFIVAALGQRRTSGLQGADQAWNRHHER